MVGYTFPPNVYMDEEGRPEPWPRGWPVNELHFDDWSGEYRQEGLTLFGRHMEAARRGGADFVIAFVHWGQEWQLAPSRHQRLAARDMIETGFDLVVGSHPHVLNPAEVVEGKLVAYSLGNFLSAFWQSEVRTSAILGVTLFQDSEGAVAVGDFAFRPVFIQGSAHIVKPLTETAKGEAGRALRTAQRILGAEAVRPF